MLTKIWERYFLLQIVKVFSLFLLCFYGLYVLIDYSNHAHSFQNYKFTFLNIVNFYAHEFVLHADALIPFAILIACIKTLSSANVHNELVALMMSGITLKRILLPFVAFGLFFTFLIYINTEVLQPNALKHRKTLDQTRSLAKQKKKNYTAVQNLTLEDGSSLVFQKFDETAQQFYDAYWIRNIDDIYRIHYLSPYLTIPEGQEVEHLQRTPLGALAISETFSYKEFPEMTFNKNKLLEVAAPASGQTLSSLKERLPSKNKILNEKEAILVTTFYYKLAIPWLCLLAVLIPVPMCTRFSRQQPLFFTYAIGLFALFSFYLVLDAATVLAEQQVLSPAIAIWVPFALFFGFFGIRFVRT